MRDAKVNSSLKKHLQNMIGFCLVEVQLLNVLGILAKYEKSDIDLMSANYRNYEKPR